eukprot:jgi/Phyca11/114040/e_gw1.25.329.1
MPTSLVFKRYLTTLIPASQCFSPGFSRKRLNLATATEMSGRVPHARYMRLPTSDR